MREHLDSAVSVLSNIWTPSDNPTILSIVDYILDTGIQSISITMVPLLVIECKWEDGETIRLEKKNENENEKKYHVLNPTDISLTSITPLQEEPHIMDTYYVCSAKQWTDLFRIKDRYIPIALLYAAAKETKM